MSQAHAVDVPILKNAFQIKLLDGTFDPDYLVWLGSSASGTEVIVKVRIYDPKRLGPKKSRILTGVRLASYLITDLTSPSLLTNDVTDRAGRLLGISKQAFVCTVTTGNGNVASAIVLAVNVIIKTATVTTDGTAGNRSLLVQSQQVSSKTVPPSTTNGDLLDREVAVPAGGVVKFNNGVVGDTYVLSY